VPAVLATRATGAEPCRARKRRVSIDPGRQHKLKALPATRRRWNTNVCVKCTDFASTNAAGKTANTECGCPVNYFSSTDTPDTTGCQPCPSNSYRNLVTTVTGETVDLKTTGVTSCTCNANYWRVNGVFVTALLCVLKLSAAGMTGYQGCSQLPQHALKSLPLGLCRWNTATLTCFKCPTGAITDPTISSQGGLLLTDCGGSLGCACLGEVWDSQVPTVGCSAAELSPDCPLPGHFAFQALWTQLPLVSPCRLPRCLLRRPGPRLPGLPRQLQQGHHRLRQVCGSHSQRRLARPLRLQQRLPGHQLRQRHTAELRAQLPGQLLPRLHRCARGLALPSQTLSCAASGAACLNADTLPAPICSRRQDLPGLPRRRQHGR
jgi:hypothetical protein